MKFIQLMYGINSSIANYACPWCKVSKEDRGVITFPQDHYNAKNIFRSIEEIRSLASSASKNKYGVKTKPLLNIELDHVVPDE